MTAEQCHAALHQLGLKTGVYVAVRLTNGQVLFGLPRVAPPWVYLASGTGPASLAINPEHIVSISHITAGAGS